MNITMVAVEKLKEFITPGEIVRLAVEGGGCAGFQYRFGLQPEEDSFSSRFKINNPDTKGTCGCGSSFN